MMQVTRPPIADLTGRVLFMEAFRRTVCDLDRSVAFYCDALGFELDMVDSAPLRGGRRAVLTLGSEVLELIAVDRAPKSGGPSREACSSCLSFQHVAIVATDMQAAWARLERFSPRAISRGQPILLPPSAGGVSAFKFRDPDGHPLELIHFPDGEGDARWHRPDTVASTVGIDHSAIVVGNAETSIAFYDGLLGFSITSRQVNHGPAQDALDGAPAVVVDVVALAAADSPTPHLELLGYRNPEPSAAVSAGQGAADQLVWAVSGLTDILARGAFAKPVRVVPNVSGDTCAVIFDPDGHAHCLIERGE